jgi:iron complex transport system substrate-binding protein
MVYRKGTISNYIFNKHGFILLMAIIMLFAMLTGCSGQKPADSANENTGPKSGVGSDTSNGPGVSAGSNTSNEPGVSAGSADYDGAETTPADSNDSDGSVTSPAEPGVSSGSGNSSSGSVTPGGDDVSSKFPLTVTDANGDLMTLERPPRRILSLNLGADEILFSLIDKNRIVSLSRYADDEGISNIAAEAKGVGARTTMDMIENIIALEPDLVILDTWADVNYIKQLRDSGITVYAFRTPGNIDEQKAVVTELAHLVGEDEKGHDIINWMEEKLRAVEDKLSALGPDQKLTVMDYGELGSSGKGTNFDDIVTRAGLINVISRAGIEGWPVISKEKIIEFNPDIIILPSWYYDPNNTFESMRDSLVNDLSLQTVSAIKNNRIISVPNQHISAISHYVVLAVEDVAKAAYPELFE